MTSRITTAASVLQALRPTVLAVMLLTAATSAYSDDKEEAKRLFDEGKTAFIEKQYDEAASDFRASVDQYPTYNGYYNLANCHKVLRQYQEALVVIEEMRRRMPGASTADMQIKFETLERSIRSVVGTLVLHVAPDGADILIDGNQVGKSPLSSPLILARGYHLVESGHAGFTASQAQVLITSEETATFRVSLTPLLAAVRVVVDVDGASITVDGIFAGKSPLKSPLTLPSGDHVIAVSKPGYEERSREISLVAAESTTLELKLAPLSVEAVPRPVQSTPAASVVRADQRRPLGLPVLFWSGLAGTVASTAGVAIFLALVANREDSFNKNDKAYLAATQKDDIEHYDKMRLDDRKQGLGFKYAGMGFGIAAGVCAAGTVVVGIMDRDNNRADERAVSVASGTLLVRF